jgi:hypothetical protein
VFTRAALAALENSPLQVGTTPPTSTVEPVVAVSTDGGAPA